MKKILIALALTSVTCVNIAYAKTIVCPTAKQANKLFKDCKISVGEESCGAKFQGTEIVLNSPVEGLYGGKHVFKGFAQFKGVVILSHHFVCKYSQKRDSEKMAWVIGSRHALPKNCHLTHSRPIIGIPMCRSANPRNCKIVCS
ncbi:hypothetical protein [Candidiatus Paracoxiella cheracis]|uniref:hypothetical protein n=1 Tax=Candidiatus Paracoxiella cheracis TaxID=3405120 RepID=UPI003BF5B0FF